LILHQQREVVVVEGLEPVVPADVFQRVSAAEAGEIEADHAGVVAAAGSAHARGPGPALFRPLADLIMVGQSS
jgi:hypothetical protein